MVSTEKSKRSTLEWLSDVAFAVFWVRDSGRLAIDRENHIQGTVKRVDVLRGLVDLIKTDGSGERVKVRGSHMADTFYSERLSF